MSISHWGFFPGFFAARSSSAGYGVTYGLSVAKSYTSGASWEPCDFDLLVQWL